MTKKKKKIIIIINLGHKKETHLRSTGTSARLRNFASFTSFTSVLTFVVCTPKIFAAVAILVTVRPVRKLSNVYCFFFFFVIFRNEFLFECMQQVVKKHA
jgi:hypothetical protein